MEDSGLEKTEVSTNLRVWVHIHVLESFSTLVHLLNTDIMPYLNTVYLVFTKKYVNSRIFF